MATFRKDDVTIRFGGDDSAFQKAAKRVKKTGNEIAGSMGKAGKAISDLFGSFKTGIAAGVAATASAMTMLAKSSLETADSLAKTADKIGVTIEDLQELRYAASTVGVEEQQLDTALQRFSRRLGEAAQGTGVLFKELQQLGIRLRDSDGTMRSVTDVLDDYADAVSRADSAQEQLRLTVAAFDTEGAGLVNLLREGADGMATIRQAAHDMGIVLDEQLIRKSEIINQTWDDMFTRMTTKLRGFALEVISSFSNIEEKVTNLAQVQTLLAEKTAELEQKQKDLAETQSDNLRFVLQRQIKALTEEIDRLRDKEKAMEGLVDVQKELNRETGKSIELEKKKRAEEEKGRPFKAAEIPQLQPGDKFQPTPEQLGDALARFRAGEISATELGRLSGLQAHDVIEPRLGAFGTLSNTMAALPSQQKAGIVQLAPDIPAFTQAMRVSLSQEEFIVKVRPVIVDDVTPLAELVDASGGRD